MWYTIVGPKLGIWTLRDKAKSKRSGLSEEAIVKLWPTRKIDLAKSQPVQIPSLGPIMVYVLTL
ncbi:MAG: hypothetical protein A3E80_02670 [Chlamydiae bacterium RIFCSPHIGHO2_12_FULL_49_9]|nr:MAG: hypothetical protein A3E80_02670 [Chlamydiae bacterium RIFCSPHIGHO2_12_FULL_49_9]